MILDTVICLGEFIIHTNWEVSNYCLQSNSPFLSRFVITSGNIGDWFGIVKLRNDSKGVALADVVVQYPLDREYDDTYQMQLVVIDDGGVSGMWP